MSLEPESASNYYKRFRVYLRLKKYKEAVSDLSSTLKYDPKHEQALSQRAKLHLRLGNCFDAEYDYNMLKRYVYVLLFHFFL